MFSWLKYRSNFISRRVLRQNIEWSKGVIFLMATFWPDGLWMAELGRILIAVAPTLESVLGQMGTPDGTGTKKEGCYEVWSSTYQTTP